MITNLINKIMAKKKAEIVVEEPKKLTEKEVLLALYDDLKSRGIRSISDLEQQIAKAE